MANAKHPNQLRWELFAFGGIDGLTLDEPDYASVSRGKNEGFRGWGNVRGVEFSLTAETRDRAKALVFAKVGELLPAHAATGAA